MAFVIFLIGCAILVNGLVFSVRWVMKRGVPPGPVNLKSTLLVYLQRLLLGTVCIAGYFVGNIHVIWLLLGGAFIFATVLGLFSVVIFQATGGLKRFENPSEGLRKYNIVKATSGVILGIFILAAWVVNWLIVLLKNS
jgi:hypothetical protein